MILGPVLVVIKIQATFAANVDQRSRKLLEDINVTIADLYLKIPTIYQSFVQAAEINLISPIDYR
jgi:hypothetical protein